MTRSFYQPSAALLLLLTSCARRERPYVPAAAPADPAAMRLVVALDGKFQFVTGSKRMLLDAPARLRLRELVPVFAFMHGAGIVEVDALVDTEGGTGAVPLRVERNGGIGYYENLKPRELCRVFEVHTPGALVRPGSDGEWRLLKTGSVLQLGLLGEPLNPLPPEPPVAVDAAEFILVWTEPEDVYRDVVLSIVALERRFPGKVVLRRPN